jgi:DNA-binding NtrC family response regulator
MSPQTRTVVLDNGDERIELSEYRLKPLAKDSDISTGRFEERKITIGSSPECDFTVSDPAVSRKHATIEADEHGYRLSDAGSKNGTFLDGNRIESAYLSENAVIRIGETELEFETTDEEREIHLPNRHRFGGLLGKSDDMREIFGLLDQIAPTDSTVLIQGESGTGKELAARAIHDHSDRRDSPFVVVDCSAISSDLIESELFGHKEGAFTGASDDRQGAFRRADGGTVFLDELGELSKDLQPKLLRVLENQRVKPVGGDTTYDIDTRILAATNRDLEQAIEEGQFREDVYYRFAVITLELPPLRDRPEDIPLLVDHFLSESADTEEDSFDVSYKTMQKLQRHDWPGNVRELRNFIERASLLSQGDDLETRFLKPDEPTEASPEEASESAAPMADLAIEQKLAFKDAKNRLVEEFEKSYWTALIKQTDGNISEAARIADMHRKSVEYILKKHDLSREEIISS